MKFCLFTILIYANFTCGMEDIFTSEISKESKSNVPSLSILAVQTIQNNIKTKGWRINDRDKVVIQAVFERYDLYAHDLFEKAIFIDTFELPHDLRVKVAKEVAKYIDEHHSATDRKSALLRLQAVSNGMRELIAKYRDN